MKTTVTIGTILIIVAMFTVSSAAQSNCCSNTLTPSNIVGTGCCIIALCDTTERTVDEVRQCKLDYWRKEVEESRKRLDKAQNDFNHAQDRVRAFEKQ